MSEQRDATATTATEARPALTSTAEPSTRQLVRDLTEQVNRLVHDEMLLLQREVLDKTRRGVRAGMALGTAGLLGFYGGGCIIAAIVQGLNYQPWAVVLGVGVVLCLVAGLIGLLGLGMLKRMGGLLPERSIDSAKQDIKAIRQAAQQ